MNFIWNIIAAIVSRPLVVDMLIKRARRTPYSNITSSDGQDVYMYRYWLFNPYSEDSGIKTGAGSELDNRRWSWLPSIRLHRIMREDQDRDFHDHPWNARTIVLRGGYTEALPGQPYLRTRLPGMTGRLLFGEYHRITSVTAGGVWTLFFTWKYRGTWGFLVDGKKVPWRTYLGKDKPTANVTPRWQAGVWRLTAPDGRSWQAESPLKACAAEQRERIPADVALKRIFAACEEPAVSSVAVPVRAPEDLRQQLGEALTEVLTDEDAAPEPDWFDSREIDRVLDVIMPILGATPPSAALATPSPAQAEPTKRYCDACEQMVTGPCNSAMCSTPELPWSPTGAAEGAEPTADAERGSVDYLIFMLQNLKRHGTSGTDKVFFNDATFGRVLVGGSVFGGGDGELELQADEEAYGDDTDTPIDDADRLDFMMEHDAFIVVAKLDHPATRYQLWNQDEDEAYHVLSGENKSFATKREAIDAAIDAARAAQKGRA